MIEGPRYGLCGAACSGRSSLLLVCGSVLLILGMSAVGFLYFARHDSPVPHPEPSRKDDTPDLAKEANDYLRQQAVEPLSGPLQTLLRDVEPKLIPSQKHPLLNEYAPTFSLPSANGKRVELEDLLSRGPVVLVFYYGYTCDHCVAQLFGLNKDVRYFTELKATVVAISPDSPEHTREMYAEYGGFDFPVLSDKDRSVAARYGVYRPPVGDLPKWQAHGTFVIGRDRYIRWATTGSSPFTGNATLLHKLAEMESLLPQRQ